MRTMLIGLSLGALALLAAPTNSGSRTQSENAWRIVAQDTSLPRIEASLTAADVTRSAAEASPAAKEASPAAKEASPAAKEASPVAKEASLPAAAPGAREVEVPALTPAARDAELPALPTRSEQPQQGEQQHIINAPVDLALREPEGPPPPPPDVPIEAVCHTLASVAQAHGLPTGFFARLIWQESKFRQRAVSPVGALGMAQFMPAVAAERGLRNPFDPLTALPHSARFLKEHIKQFGNLGLAAAAYNGGARRVMDWLARRGKLPEETRNYVKSITGQPPEKWIQPNEIEVAVNLPRRAPCEGVADLSYDAAPAKVAVQLEGAAAQAVAEARAREAAAREKKLAAQKAKRERMLAKAKDKDKTAKTEVAEIATDTETKAGQKAKAAEPKTAAKSELKTAAKSSPAKPSHKPAQLKTAAKPKDEKVADAAAAKAGKSKTAAKEKTKQADSAKQSKIADRVTGTSVKVATATAKR